MDSADVKPHPRTIFHAALAALALALCACAGATRPASSERPRANEPPYPVVLAAAEERRAGALAGWKVVAGEQAAASSPAPELQPVTATLKALPAGLAEPPRLPVVVIGDEAEQSEEETRESLRQFIRAAAPLLGVNLQELSLISVTDAAGAQGGARRAVYKQNPFQHPLRNGYGLVEITFTPDLRVTQLSSTAVPDSERLRRALAAVTQKLTAAQAVAKLNNSAVTFGGADGARQTRTLTQADAVVARELVVFPIRRPAAADSLELHLAWEIAVGGPESPLLVYVDAVTGEQLAASQAGAAGPPA